MTTLYILMFAAAVICFVLDAFKLVTAKVNLTALGLALAFGVFLIQQIRLA